MSDQRPVYGGKDHSEILPSPQYALDHWPITPASHHIWMTNSLRVKKRKVRDTFLGHLYIMEKLTAGNHYTEVETVWTRKHDIWCVGPGWFECGEHGEECPIRSLWTPLVEHWMRGGDQYWKTVRCSVTWDGRVIPFTGQMFQQAHSEARRTLLTE